VAARSSTFATHPSRVAPLPAIDGPVPDRKYGNADKLPWQEKQIAVADRSPTAFYDNVYNVLRRGELVILPTETVYGLAADALSATAVAKIFETKQRPHFDPLIVHLPGPDWLEKIAVIKGDARPLIERLATAFWPGPLTMVLPKTEWIPSLVTAGLTTVAVRMSAHPIFREVVQSFGQPLAAPSANRFGRISPTTAADVLEELVGRIPLIVDGGSTTHGIESTVIAPRGGVIEILRPGPITREELESFGQVQFRN